ncbi:MAG TPA: hypothetical protein VGP04_20275, partial [Pseudonocardiaceae bacterium]|nr:hypothetical protein [Pseudonocardiaceae bacterium]
MAQVLTAQPQERTRDAPGSIDRAPGVFAVDPATRPPRHRTRGGGRHARRVNRTRGRAVLGVAGLAQAVIAPITGEPAGLAER